MGMRENHGRDFTAIKWDLAIFRFRLLAMTLEQPTVQHDLVLACIQYVHGAGYLANGPFEGDAYH
jgi:hypothetical protein